MLVRGRSAWAQQPQGAVVLRPEFAASTVSLPGASSWVDLVTQGAWAVNNAGSISASACNAGRSLLQGGTGYWSRTNPVTSGPMTVLITYTPTSAGINAGIWSIASAAASGSPAFYLAQATTSIQFYDGATYALTFTNVVTAGVPLHICIAISDTTVGAATTYSVTINGVTQSGSRASDARARTSEYLASGFAGTATGHFSLYARIPARVPDALAAQLTRNPWQLFQRRPPVFAGVAGGPAAAAFDAVATGSATASAALTTQIKLAGSATGSAAAAAALSTAIKLDAGASASATASAALSTTPAGMVAAAMASATATASLSTSIRAQASATASATATATLLAAIRLAASATASATGSADLTTGAAASLSAAAVSSAVAAATLTTQILLRATAQASAAMSANLSTGSPASDPSERFTVSASQRVIEVVSAIRTLEIGASPRRMEVRS